MNLFKRQYVVRYGTASLSIQPSYMVVKAFSRKDAYKRVKKTLPSNYLVTDIYRCPRWLKPKKNVRYYEPDKRYDE